MNPSYQSHLWCKSLRCVYLNQHDLFYGQMHKAACCLTNAWNNLFQMTSRYRIQLWPKHPACAHSSSNCSPSSLLWPQTMNAKCLYNCQRTTSFCYQIAQGLLIYLKVAGKKGLQKSPVVKVAKVIGHLMPLKDKSTVTWVQYCRHFSQLSLIRVTRIDRRKPSLEKVNVNSIFLDEVASKTRGA